VDVIPVSDPNAATMAQKIVTYQAVLQLAQSAPQLYDLPLLHRQMIEVLGVKNAAKLVPIEDDAIPVDPVQENQDMLTGKPLKAFIEQNHDAHMMAHQSFLQDPMIQQMLMQPVMGQPNPQAQMMMSAMVAHINQHMAFKYRLQVEQMTGMTLPDYDKYRQEGADAPEIPKEMADQIAIMAAQATQQILTQDQQAAAQQAAQQQMQDPVVQMQMQELQIKAQDQQPKQEDLKIKAQKMMIDATATADKQELEQEKVRGQLQLDAMRVAAQIQKDKAQMVADQMKEGVRMGIDIAKAQDQAKKGPPRK